MASEEEEQSPCRGRISELAPVVSGAPDAAAHTQGVVASPASNRHHTVKPAVPGVPGSVLLSGWAKPHTSYCAEGTSVNCVAFLNAQGARLCTWSWRTLGGSSGGGGKTGAQKWLGSISSPHPTPVSPPGVVGLRSPGLSLGSLPSLFPS